MTSKEILVTIIKQKGNCSDPTYCSCANGCPLLNVSEKQCHWRTIHSHRVSEESVIHELVYKESLRLFVERYGKDELLEILL